MNTFDINTSQNVVINYAVASVGDRMIACFIDTLIKIGYFLLVIYAVSEVYPNAGWWVYIVLMLPALLFSFLFELFMQGQTPGKRMRKIKVVKIDGGQPGIGAYLIRWLFRIIDVNLFNGIVAIITIILNKKGQRLGDILAQTTVIKVQDRFALKDTIYEKVNADYVVTYHEARRLSSEDIQLIKRFLNSETYRNNFEMLYSLTDKIVEKMKIERQGSPEDFLETVVKDYNYLYDE